MKTRVQETSTVPQPKADLVTDNHPAIQSHFKRRTDGRFEGVGFLSAESIAMIDHGVACVALRYARGPEHAQQVNAGNVEPDVFQIFIAPTQLRAVAALLLRAADAVEGKVLTRQ